MKLLSIVGTAAMFLVGGGILSHGFPALHHGIEHVAEMAGVLSSIVSMSLDGLVGIVAGAVALLGMLAFSAVRGKFKGVQA
jgi:predicted DNA repair protein MutK